MITQTRTRGVHHVALRCTDLARSKSFYTELLGFPVALEGDGICLFMAGETPIGIRAADDHMPPGDTFSPHRVGLDHVALACDDEAELDRLAGRLDEAGVWNTGVKMDDVLGKRYVAFKDPDGIKWELYMT
jgi:glyoxylase I family protein